MSLTETELRQAMHDETEQLGMAVSMPAIRSRSRRRAHGRNAALAAVAVAVAGAVAVPSVIAYFVGSRAGSPARGGCWGFPIKAKHPIKAEHRSTDAGSSARDLRDTPGRAEARPLVRPRTSAGWAGLRRQGHRARRDQGADD
jgi:hypothetical protein